MSIAPPNYTQLPNLILDRQSEMTEAQLRIMVAVCRKTFGWHKQRDRISLSQFEQMTGMSRMGCIRGIKACVLAGWLFKVSVPGGFAYELSLQDEQREQSPLPLASHPSLLPLVTVGDSPLVTVGDSQKKENLLKKPKEKTTGAGAPRARDPLFDAIVEVCQVDPVTAGASIGKVKTILLKATPPYTVEEICAFGKDWWSWSERTAPPSIWKLKEQIGKVRRIQPTGGTHAGQQKNTRRSNGSAGGTPIGSKPLTWTPPAGDL